MCFYNIFCGTGMVFEVNKYFFICVYANPDLDKLSSPSAYDGRVSTALRQSVQLVANRGSNPCGTEFLQGGLSKAMKEFPK